VHADPRAADDGRYNVRNDLNFGTLMRTETTFGHLLKQAGYATGICGKWQRRRGDGLAPALRL